MSMKKIKAIVEGEIELDFEINTDEARTLLGEINAAIANHKREWRDAMGSVWEKEDMAQMGNQISLPVRAGSCLEK